MSSPSLDDSTNRLISVDVDATRPARWQDIAPILVVVVLFVVGFVLLLIQPIRERIVELLDLAKDSPTAAILFCLVFVVSILLGLPSVIFVVAAGIVWGGPLGFFSVWIGGIIGAAIVFQVGRTWLKTSLEVLCWNKSATLKEVKKLISDPESGWKWALLIRLPYMPYPQMSYALSAVFHARPSSTQAFTTLARKFLQADPARMAVFVARAD